MSISRQLALGIGLLMVLIMTGNLMINIGKLKSQFEHQLAARADETATTLALSMTQSVELYDDAALRSMVDVVFDRGHFLEIRFDYIDSDKYVARYAPDDGVSVVPSWLHGTLKLNAKRAQTYVSQGWHQLGTLSVRLHPGPMYGQLWELVKAEVAWFALMAFIAIYGVRILLIWQLQPLKQVLELADKLAHNQFLHITQQPKARELARLVDGMNALSDRLHASFSAHGETIYALQQEAISDELTGLNNRKGLDQFLQDWMKADGFSPGWLMLLQIENLTQLNEQHGKAVVDDILLQVAMLLKTEPMLSHEHVCKARSGGGEFWVFCPDTLDGLLHKRLQQLSEHLLRLSLLEQHQAQLRIAVLPCDDIVAPSSLKHQLDILLQRGNSAQQVLTLGELEKHSLIHWVHWQKRLKAALAQESIELFAQPLFNAAGNVMQQEVHCRLLQEDGPSLEAGFFWPIIDKLKFSSQFDLLVLKHWQSFMLNHEAQGDWVINVSAKSLDDEHFRQEFLTTLDKTLCANLILECSEYTLVHMGEDAMHWLHDIHELGLRLSVDHVGTSGKSFGFLARFPVYQGKIEKRFIRDIQQHKEHKLFVSGMTQVLHGQKALCLAEGIEQDSEKSTLWEMGLDGLMGYDLAKPQPISDAVQS